MHRTETIQAILLKKLEDILPSNHSIANELADLLDLSTDSIYRRIRGESQLTVEEVAKICHHFQISFDACNNIAANTVTFNYKKLNTFDDLGGYLENMLKQLQRIIKGDSSDIIYAAIDIPVFHHFGYEMVSAFKMFYWLHSVMNVPELEKQQFDFNHIPKEFLETGKEIFDLYCKVPSAEIWSETTMNSMVKQIEFYWESGIFKSKDDALMLCDDFEKQLNTILKMAEGSSKLLNAVENYTLYHSDIEIGNNCIQAHIGGAAATYISHHTFNSLIAYNQDFNEETDKWLKNLLKKSNILSGVGHRQRFQFFNKAIRQINALKVIIESE